MEITSMDDQLTLVVTDITEFDCCDCGETVTIKTTGECDKYLMCPECESYEFYPSDIHGDSDSNVFKYIPLTTPIN